MVLSSRLAGIRKGEFIFCGSQLCAPVTLMRCHLLAASPKRPTRAFHLSLREFCSVLRVEGHTAVQAFTNTLAHVHRYLKPNTLRKNMGLSFFVYLEVLDIVSLLLNDRAPVAKDKGCPCCSNDKLIVAMDGNFQLKRRKADKEDDEKVQHPNFFQANGRQGIYDGELEAIDEVPSGGSSNCTSNFQAEGTALTPRSRNKFNETGLFGSACARHGIPLEFTDIYASGEQFKYPCGSAGRPHREVRQQRRCHVEDTVFGTDPLWQAGQGFSLPALRMYTNKLRAEEELCLLRHERTQLEAYAEQRCRNLEETMRVTSDAGYRCLLSKQLEAAEQLYSSVHGRPFHFGNADSSVSEGAPDSGDEKDEVDENDDEAGGEDYARTYGEIVAEVLENDTEESLVD
ncbi:hypothetical protein BCR43DRAFT_490261 [Syncephalastrum racemosum]|uniref:CxC1-like cysteine cluster associated with KDZ transposases domain-containing protein n=1 Tax=Syncephalastrum racemosum TaxID=13706 RepID=A0A1X2HFN8_SYNRA|nr:hypothetical protein BCR43DRAFT_490261 [Syncephalastrum racemosum]